MHTMVIGNVGKVTEVALDKLTAETHCASFLLCSSPRLHHFTMT